MFLCQWLDVADSCVFGNFKCAAIVTKPFTPGLFCVCQYGAKELSHLSGQIMGRQVGHCCFPLHITSAALKSFCKQDCGTSPWKDSFPASPLPWEASQHRQEKRCWVQSWHLQVSTILTLVKKMRRTWPCGVSDIAISCEQPRGCVCRRTSWVPVLCWALRAPQ